MEKNLEENLWEIAAFLLVLLCLVLTYVYPYESLSIKPSKHFCLLGMMR